MSDAPLLSIEDSIADSIEIDRAAKAVGVDRNKAREFLAALAHLPIPKVERMILGAYDHRVKAANRATRLGR